MIVGGVIMCGVMCLLWRVCVASSSDCVVGHVYGPVCDCVPVMG